MNPSNAGQVIKMAVNLFGKPNPAPNVVAPIPQSQVLTQQLPANIASPIPQSQVVPYPAGTSSVFDGMVQQWKHNANDLQAAIQNALTYKQEWRKPIQAAEAPSLPSASPAPMVSPTPTATQTPKLDQLAQQIAQGFTQYGRPEAAAYAKYFAEAGQKLPDPYLPATLAIKETSGGKNLAHQNNWLNIGPDIDYPDVSSNIVGGEGHKGFAGVINSGLYDKYLKSGNLQDFFQTYTPTYDKNGKQVNGTYADQIKQYNELRKIFTKN